MNTYLFKTTTTMKEYNNKKWWIDSDVVKEIEIEAENVNTALKEYQKEVTEKFYIEISDNAIKNKNPMYIDTDTGKNKLAMLLLAKLILKTIINGLYSTLICG